MKDQGYETGKREKDDRYWLCLLRNGTFCNSSILSRASSSAFDSGNRSWSFASTRKTIPLTSGFDFKVSLETSRREDY